VFLFCGSCGGVRRDCASAGEMEAASEQSASAKAAAARHVQDIFMT
jgi:hypothetical protein